MTPDSLIEHTTATIRMPDEDIWLYADVGMPSCARGVVVFANGSGSSRQSPRNQAVARSLEERGLGTVLVDLLTRDEEQIDRQTERYRFDIERLAHRLVGVIDWLARREAAGLSVGLFGASTGAGAALVAAALRPDDVAAVVSRGGRPDLAGGALRGVTAPTLLIVGGLDTPVIQMNNEAMALMTGRVRLEIVPGATHLFEEPGALTHVADLASDWFVEHLTASRRQPAHEGRSRRAAP